MNRLCLFGPSVSAFAAFGARLTICALVFVIFALGIWPASATVIAAHGRAEMVIVTDPAATATERFAAHELAAVLQQITGATFVIQTNATAPARAIFVGPGTAARALFKDVAFDKLGNEELIVRSRDDNLLLAGGRPRGTIYAVSRFLQEQCGVRWWTPWARTIPKQSTLQIGNLNLREKPAFEYREPFWFTAFDADWAWQNGCNGSSFPIPPDKGGHIIYKGFVHTSYTLVPPSEYFSTHPEWFALINGKRKGHDAQLCLTNPKLRDFVVQRVKEWLRESPDANIVSVSQNDNTSPCECTNCRALDAEEGSHAGSMIAFVNYVAERIEPEFPNVAIDTLAYQYTRKPPKTLRPRPNVIVRLCSIECNFGEPLDGPSNAAFADDIRGWSEIADRLYVWDYVTDFAHYVQPHPNWFTMGPNLRFFQAHHVKGVFEEGAYQSYGSEMAEMRAWVLAQLMWNPQQDDRALIREFLNGYYGKAAEPIWRYMELLNDAARGYNLTCYSPTSAPFLQFRTLAEAEKLWQQAEDAVAGDEELLARVRLGHLAVRYVWLAQWDALRQECAASHGIWPLSNSFRDVAAEWREVANGVPGKVWTQVTSISEGGTTPDQFLSTASGKDVQPDKLPELTIPAGAGVNIHFTTGHEQDLKMIAAAGFKFVRMDFSWTKTEPRKGEYDWSDYDAFTAELERHGLRPYYIFGYSSQLYEGMQSSINPVTHQLENALASPQHPESIAAYARWAAAAAKHFHGRGVIWEIWNEPNISFWKPRPDVAQYAALALAAARAIRAADPQACIVGPTTSGFDWNFLEAVFKSGLLNYLDAVSVHPYRQQSPETAASDFARLRSLIAHYAPAGKTIPILSGEWGYSTSWKGVSEQRQADYAVREQLSNLLNGVPLSIWYDWKNDGQDPANSEHNFGTVGYGLSLKPAYVAIQTMTRELSGYSIAQRFDTGNTNDFVLVLTNGDGQCKLAAWTVTKPHRIEYHSRGLDLTGMPQYVRWP
ncbi:MAG TPA: DUF4838 domain-containing protein [Alphaproteobacteria bacterium]|nr:DUF4838 domain-containing protein [Alphaproteobacteria bacterium]